MTADLAVVDGKVDGSMSRRRLFPLLSTAKPILAATALTVCRDAGLSLDHLLVDTIPELAGQGRERIRVRDVLTHQTGFPPMPTHPGLVAASWPDAFQGTTQVPAGTSIKPGTDGCYQEWRYWYLLGELITRITALPVPEVVRTRVLRPLGLDGEIVLGPAPPDDPTQRSDPQLGWRGGVHTYGSIRAIATFLAALPGGPDFQPDGVFRDLPAIAAPWRSGLPDRYFSHIRDWGLGVMLESVRWGRRSLVFSRLASHRTYGHVARGAIAAFVDPVHQLTAGIFASGDLNAIQTSYLLRSACTAIYRMAEPGRPTTPVPHQPHRGLGNELHRAGHPEHPQRLHVQ